MTSGFIVNSTVVSGKDVIPMAVLEKLDERTMSPEERIFRHWLLQVGMSRLGEEETRTLLALAGQILGASIDGHFVALSQTEIAEHTGMHRQQVSRSFKSLERRGLVERGPKVGVSSSYRLNFRYQAHPPKEPMQLDLYGDPHHHQSPTI